MLPKASECIFCANPAIAPEHIYSRKWLAALWKVPKGHQLQHQRKRSYSDRDEGGFDIWWLRSEADLIVHCVCNSCNSGWMNTLDRRAQKIINPMTRGDRAEIRTLRDQMVVVHWALKIAFMFDYTQDASMIPVALARAFRAHGEIPANTYVWLARNVPMVEGHATGATHTMSRGDDPEVYLLTFRIDQLVVQVVIGIAVPVRPIGPATAMHCSRCGP